MQEHNIEVGPFAFADGSRLENVRQRITTYGDPRSPALLVPHALTGSSRVTEWWGALVGEGKLLDPSRWYIIGINALGSCYGSSGPSTAADFPYVTVRDIVAAQARALEQIGVQRLSLVIGASLGGMQALQWALDYPQRVQRAVMVGSHDHQSPMGIALNAIQREAITIDPARGLRIARKIAMLSYKSDALFKDRHDRRADRKGRFRYDIEGYLEHQAEVFQARMDPRSYVALTEAMDSFDVRNHVAALNHTRHGEPVNATRHGEPVNATRHDEPVNATRHGEPVNATRHGEPVEPRPSLLFVGISSDWLFLPQDVRAAAQRFAHLGYASEYAEIDSDHGHDAFLAEPEVFASILSEHGVGTGVRC